MPDHPRRTRLAEAVSLQHDRTQQAWAWKDTGIRAQAERGSIDAADLTAWYRLAVERRWWQALLAAVDTREAAADVGLQIDAADGVLNRAALAQVVIPPLAEPLPFEIAATLLDLDAIARFLATARVLIDGITY
ncbi:hypothetical protein [Phytomonospora endophytica]|uniref:Uncharacterized protein n=1 Tax=Phytomonospora endophytica TaxID=714109 RepID=A0A841FUU6_9ACTN|nr:hypothetical protein [Phytomonospora endophytica]MBB6038533.1 hypothetical protein [Phytomonospora endophytica]GIG69327.1 hypothetical protein Pen01_56220 [Phytomonospora endophytica]